MALETRGWTVLMRGGVPKDWARAAEAVLGAMPSAGLTRADANRAVRMGQGFVDLPLAQDASERVAEALSAQGVEARGLRWAECEAAEVPLRARRVDFGGEEAVPGLPWARVQLVHVALAEPTPFFLPPEVNESTRLLGRVATGVGLGASALDLPGVGEAAGAVGKLADALGLPVTPSDRAPELLIELLGLWAPRVQLPVTDFQHETVPGEPIIGSRPRLARLLSLVLEKAPRARRLGCVEEALSQRALDGVRPLPAGDHKRLVSALLTATRLWPA
ncbi:MAG: hypothetical protein AMXMBFR34_11930 [Myxococcaceae bacterium]